jgi:quinol monooxygenase YgiN
MPAFRSCTALGFLLVAFEVLAQGAAPLYVVTYVEVRPPAKSEAATLLKSHRDATRRDEGNLRSEAVQHAARPGQFVLLTAWKDQKAYEAHAAAASTREFRDRLQGLRNSPADDRIHNALSVGDPDSATLAAATTATCATKSSSRPTGRTISP